MKNIISLLVILLFPIALLSQDYEEIKESQLPKGAKAYITKNMPGAEISRAAKGIENGQTIYAAVIEVRNDTRVMIFDEKGNFLRRAKDLSSSTDPPPMSTTANPKSESAPKSRPNTVPQETITEKSLPASAQKLIKDNHTNYTLLEVKFIPLGESPMYKVILRDTKSDNVYIFDAAGGKKSQRTYPIASSPFTKQFPLKK